MTAIDYFIFVSYMAGVVGVGYYFYRRNKSNDDYYVGGRNLPASHVGISVVATDVGGGFSIGLGGLGFVMGIAGSWLLFTGLVGAWLSAVLIIPRLKKVDSKLLTYPDFLRARYGSRVATVAAVITGIGYLGFTGGQILAGAKLAAATLIPIAPWGLSPLVFSMLVIAVVTVVYTALGGLKAVIYTDSIQWVVLLLGLSTVTGMVLFGDHLGGLAGLRRELPAGHFSLTNIDAVTLVNWAVTIIPIWVVAMTLYQRVYACGSVREAQRAWFIAGLLEYPIMAFLGAFLGMCARAAFPTADAEMALPMLMQASLPIGITGLIVAAYFSAIMSTADSCLMAASGTVVSDILDRHFLVPAKGKAAVRRSQWVTLLIGMLAVAIASQFTMVLEAILFAYSFMIAGLFVPTLGAYFWPRGSSRGALFAMLLGGGTTLILSAPWMRLPDPIGSWGLDPTVWGVLISAISFIAISLADNPSGPTEETAHV